MEDEEEEEDISRDEIQQSLHKYANEDFETFLSTAKNQKYVNMVHLIADVVQHFI